MMTPVGSKEITADGIVSAAPGMLVSVLLAGGSGASSVVLYDNASAASGTILATVKAIATDSREWSPAQPIVCSKGIYADISGTGAAAYIAYV